MSKVKKSVREVKKEIEIKTLNNDFIRSEQIKNAHKREELIKTKVKIILFCIVNSIIVIACWKAFIEGNYEAVISISTFMLGGP